MARILITGASGYIGGELLYQIKQANLGAAIFAAVRNHSLHDKVRELGFEPVNPDLSNKDAIISFIIDKQVNIVVELVDPVGLDIAVPAIQALAKVNGPGKGRLISSGGAKFFADFSGFDTTVPLADDAEDLKERQADAKTRATWAVGPKGADNFNTIFALGTELKVNTQIVIPPIVYGKSRTFGNPLTRQLVEAVTVARKLKTLYRPPTVPHSKGLEQTYALCHIKDCARVYLLLIQAAIGDKSVERGFYFTENGVLEWDKLYSLVLTGLGYKPEVREPDEKNLDEMASALGVDKKDLTVRFGGRSNIQGNNARKLGWVPRYDAEHLYATVADEAKWISAELENK